MSFKSLNLNELTIRDEKFVDDVDVDVEQAETGVESKHWRGRGVDQMEGIILNYL